MTPHQLAPGIWRLSSGVGWQSIYVPQLGQRVWARRMKRGVVWTMPTSGSRWASYAARKIDGRWKAWDVPEKRGKMYAGMTRAMALGKKVL